VTGPADFTLPGGIELRPFEEGDAPELYALIERNRIELKRWMQMGHDRTPGQALAFVRRARAKEAEELGMQRAIVAEQRIVGVVGFPVIDRANRSASIGYWLDGGQQGRGVMTAAVAALSRHAFDELNLIRLEIRTDVENLASRAVAERVGFRYEGTLRQAYWVGDRYSDDAVYSMLGAERAALGGYGARLKGSR
jgi:ribosomal-protein-serine acetyltransferase